MAVLLHLRRIATAALLAAGVALGGSAFGDPAIACAKPVNRDFLAKCNAFWNEQYTNGGIGLKQYQEEIAACCTKAGGEINEDPYDPRGIGCVEKKKADADAQPTLPGVAPRPGVIGTEPSAPPPPVIRNPEVTMTFQPGPVGPVG